MRAMSKEKTLTKNRLSTSSFWGELFQLGVYKRTQGRITRQVTCVAIWVVFALGALKLSETLILVESLGTNGRYLLVAAWMIFGILLGYRLVNYSKFADFLIAVEAEMSKVSWPSRGELVRSSIVVIVVMFFLAIVLAAFDIFWVKLFSLLGIHG